MAYISDENEFLFFAAPATGSTAVIEALSKAGIGHYLPSENLVKDGRLLVPRKHSTMRELEDHGLLGVERSAYCKVVGVRNPFSFHVAKYLRNTRQRVKQLENPRSWINRLPSEARDRASRQLRRQAQMTFEQYLHDLLDRLEQPTAVQAHFLEGMDFYIHQEDSSADFDRFCELTGTNAAGKLRRVNVSGLMADGKTYRDFYSSELIDLVYAQNAPSFDRFPEYSFEGFSPSESRYSKHSHP